jgi:hypothetical protein
MTILPEIKQNPAKVLAVEIIALNPSISAKEVAQKTNVSENLVRDWRKDPNFIDACYDRYMVEFGSQLPSVLNAMVREAQAGNVQAGRLVLEHSGKLVKNINITIDSPFEKFLKSVPDAEVVQDEDIIDAAESVDVSFEDLPPRNTENQDVRAKKEEIKTHKAILNEEKRIKRNKKQKEWYKWRKRAKAVGVQFLKGRRPTPAQRKEWEKKILQKEKELRVV